MTLFHTGRYLECVELQKYIIAKFPANAAVARDSITTLYDKLGAGAFGLEKYVETPDISFFGII